MERDQQFVAKSLVNLVTFGYFWRDCKNQKLFAQMQPTTQNTKNVCFCLPTSKPHFSDLLLKANNDTVKKKSELIPTTSKH